MNEAAERFAEALARMPLIAILRGVKPDEAVPIGHMLLDEGWTIVEVPLNSPQPFDSIAALSAAFGDRLVVGAGTVVEPDAVGATASAGGQLVVAPNFDVGVVSAAIAAGLAALPGIFTPTEAFAALKAGAHALKLFPAEAAGPAVVKAMLAVLPPGTTIIPVGGIAPDSLAPYWQAGARGFGIGSALYKPGMTIDTVRRNARAFAEAARRSGCSG
jgi:2-dehydro-3-deoxyphosphogalactonate aldolase